MFFLILFEANGRQQKEGPAGANTLEMNRIVAPTIRFRHVITPRAKGSADCKRRAFTAAPLGYQPFGRKAFQCETPVDARDAGGNQACLDQTGYIFIQCKQLQMWQ